jgi:LuxR family maltose regulon positive regulatory protein
MSIHSECTVKLIHRLQAGGFYRLALLIAPAGSGKTACLRRWAKDHEALGLGKVAWAVLDESADLPDTFLARLQTALEPGQPAGYSHPASSLEDGLIDLLNSLSARREHRVLVLDGYDAIRSPEIHGAVSLMLDYLPPNLLIIISARCAPPLPLARLRVRRQILELGPEVLLEEKT